MNKFETQDIQFALDYIERLKREVKDGEIMNKFEYQDRQFVLDYIERLKREVKEGKL